MKTFKDIISELTDPTPRRQKEFIDKHTIQVIDYPAGKPDQLSVKNIKKDKTKKASHHDGEDAAVYEETMSDAEMKKREDIVKGMKKNKADFQKRYGDKWKSVMYATATKSAMKEEAELEEAFKKGDTVKPTKGPHKGVPHEVIHDFGDGNYNIKPKGLNPKQIRYSMGAAKAHKSDLVKEEVEQLDELSPNTLSSYASKANIDASKARSHMRVSAGGKDFATHKKRYDKRTAGAVKAGEKYRKLVAREETELDEETMSDAEMKKREDIVKGMKKNKADFQKRYGDRWKSVMYATATKSAMKEEVEELDEGRIKAVGGQRSARMGASKEVSNNPIPKRGTKAHAEFMAKALQKHKDRIGVKEETELDHKNLNSIAKDHEAAAKKHKTAYAETSDTAAARNHEVAYNRHVDAAKAHREAANDKSKHSSEKLEKMSNHAWDATDHIKKHFNEEVEQIDEAFKAGSMKLKDGSSATVTKESADVLNSLFKQLNSANKAKMEERLMSDAKGFNEILAFAKEVA